MARLDLDLLRDAGLCAVIVCACSYYDECARCSKQCPIWGDAGYLLCTDLACYRAKAEAEEEMQREQEVPAEQPEAEPEAPESHSVRTEEEWIEQKATEEDGADVSAGMPAPGVREVAEVAGIDPDVPTMEAVPVPAHVGPQEVEATATRARVEPAGIGLETLVGVPRPILQDAITALDNAITAFVGTYFDGVDCQVVEDVVQECNAAMWGLRAVIDPADDLPAEPTPAVPEIEASPSCDNCHAADDGSECVQEESRVDGVCRNWKGASDE